MSQAAWHRAPAQLAHPSTRHQVLGWARLVGAHPRQAERSRQVIRGTVAWSVHSRLGNLQLIPGHCHASDCRH